MALLVSGNFKQHAELFLWHECYFTGWCSIGFNRNSIQSTLKLCSNSCPTQVILASSNDPWFLHVCSTNSLKTLWEKEKLIVTSNFSFSQYFLPSQRPIHHFHQIQNSSANSFSLEESKICHLGLIDWMVFNDIFNSISVILWRPVHLSMLSWSSFNHYSAQYSFQATGCFPT